MLGLNKDVVGLVEHADNWKELFSEEKESIERR